MPYRVYILLCSDGSYYAGSAADVEKRVCEHQDGVMPTSYTFTRRPVKLLWTSEEVERYSDALRFERQVKGWSRAKKEALIKGDWNNIHEEVKRNRQKQDARHRKSKTS